jgi:hypothetical protein
VQIGYEVLAAYSSPKMAAIAVVQCQVFTGNYVNDVVYFILNRWERER